MALRQSATHANYLIDLDHAVIIDVEATTAIRQAEVGAARTMIERVRERHDLRPAGLAADTAYGSAEMLQWLVHDQGIAPHIPVMDRSQREDGTFSRSDFAYDRQDDLYRCPGGKVLKRYRRAFSAPRTDMPADDTHRYRASKTDCDACPLKSRCCPRTPARKVTRSIHEGAREIARDIVTTTPTSPHGASGRRSRCCSPISSASSSSIGCDYAAHAAPETSFSSPLPPRTSANSPS